MLSFFGAILCLAAKTVFLISLDIVFTYGTIDKAIRVSWGSSSFDVMIIDTTNVVRIAKLGTGMFVSQKKEKRGKFELV